MAAIRYYDIDALEEYLENGWMVDSTKYKYVYDFLVEDIIDENTEEQDIEYYEQKNEEKRRILDLLLKYGYTSNMINKGLIIYWNKGSAYVEWNGKRVQFSGELGKGGFATSAKTMKWMYPNRDKLATKEEQDEWVEKVNNYYSTINNEKNNTRRFCAFRKKLKQMDRLFFLSDEDWD